MIVFHYQTFGFGESTSKGISADASCCPGIDTTPTLMDEVPIPQPITNSFTLSMAGFPW